MGIYKGFIEGTYKLSYDSQTKTGSMAKNRLI